MKDEDEETYSLSHSRLKMLDDQFDSLVFGPHRELLWDDHA